MADNPRKKVIEIMGDSSRQRPDRLHLLRLLELGFEPFALGDVSVDPTKPDGFAVAVFQQRKQRLDMRPRSVLSNDLVADGYRRYVLPEEAQAVFFHKPCIFRIQVQPVIHPRHLFPGVSQELRQHGVEEGQVAPQVGLKITVIHVLEDAPVLFLAILECLCCPSVLGDVTDYTPEAGGTTIRISQQRSAKFMRPPRSVFPDDIPFTTF